MTKTVTRKLVLYPHSAPVMAYSEGRMAMVYGSPAELLRTELIQRSEKKSAPKVYVVFH